MKMVWPGGLRREVADTRWVSLLCPGLWISLMFLLLISCIRLPKHPCGRRTTFSLQMRKQVSGHTSQQVARPGVEWGSWPTEAPACLPVAVWGVANSPPRFPCYSLNFPLKFSIVFLISIRTSIHA